ncbi:MAG: 16S rRNA processing protein RimM [Desulfobulbaceae bacterium]|nr:MAG: 16S rRNA processing protein RimM [Desulfobulbaceae bacterium]
MTKPGGLIQVGKIGKPHGLRGELKIYSLADRPSNFLTYRHLILLAEAGEPHEYEVAKVRIKGNFAIVALAGVTDRNQAEELVGCQVWVPPEYLAPLADDEFYWHTVMGAEVVDRQGQVLGRLASLMSAGGGEVMVVRDRDEELLIPSLPEFLVEIGPEKIVVDLPDGLLDVNRKK